jgi:hypothetical protein
VTVTQHVLEYRVWCEAVRPLHTTFGATRRKVLGPQEAFAISFSFAPSLTCHLRLPLPSRSTRWSGVRAPLIRPPAPSVLVPLSFVRLRALLTGSAHILPLPARFHLFDPPALPPHSLRFAPLHHSTHPLPPLLSLSQSTQSSRRSTPPRRGSTWPTRTKSSPT